ncbi:MAG: hypothetical protein KGI50_07255 [Patescibacteria group bacterium]|nr:hypothetical protein [Patescibacteria group bacterium]
MDIQELNLSLRLTNCLRYEGIKTLEQITERRERDLWKIPNFGEKSMAEIKEVLSKHGLSLKKELVG